MSRMTHFSPPVTVQTVVGSFYNHANFSAVTKPQSTFLRLDIYEGEERGTNGVHAAAKSASVEGGSDLSPILSVANAAQFLFRLEGVLVLHREWSGHQIYIHAFTPPMAKVPVSKAEDPGRDSMAA